MTTTLYILLWAAALAAPSTHGQSAEEVAISYSVPPSRLTLHEPVVLEFSVNNNTERSISLDLGQDRKGGYEFWVTPPKGGRLQLPQYRREGMSRIGKVSVRPGEIFSQSLILNEWYRFREPGTYIVEGRLTAPVLFENIEREQRDPGFRVSIQIEPRDELNLAAACNSLVNDIDASQSYERSAEAALALSYVDDPVAVPYLRRALFARKLVEPIAIQGLEEIADDEAVRALASALNGQMPGRTTILAKAALERIEQRTQDATRKEAIKHILEEKNNDR